MPVVLRERYRLGHRLGSGGAADVHRATDTTLQRPVAVKVLRDVAGDASTRDRFVAEARTLASMSHRNLVVVLDAGIGDGDDKPFLVMELVEGRSLADALATGPLPPPEAARVGAEVAAGLAYAHERGVVHRDVKPGNVLLSDDGRVKLADFGIARLLGDTVRHTRTGTAIGTAAYLSPEQVRGEEVSGAADVYALGLVLLEVLTGHRAFPGTATEAALARLHRDPEVPDDLPAGWAPLLVAMTAADPAARPAAPEVARRLGGLAVATPAPAPGSTASTALLTAPVVLEETAEPPGQSEDDEQPGRTLDRAGDAIARTPGLLLARWRGLEPHHRGVAGALAAIVLLVLVAGLAAGATGSPDRDAPAPASPTPGGQRPDEPAGAATDQPRDTEPTEDAPAPARLDGPGTSSGADRGGSPGKGSKVTGPKVKGPGHGGAPPGKAKGHQKH